MPIKVNTIGRKRLVQILEHDFKAVHRGNDRESYE